MDFSFKKDEPNQGLLKKKELLSKGCEDFCNRIKRTIDPDHVKFSKTEDSSNNLETTINITRNGTKILDKEDDEVTNPKSPLKRLTTLDQSKINQVQSQSTNSPAAF